MEKNIEDYSPLPLLNDFLYFNANRVAGINNFYKDIKVIHHNA